LVNLANVIDDPSFERTAVGGTTLALLLNDLQRTSDAFIDLGIVDADGDLEAYVGPVDFPTQVNYGDEIWWRTLLSGTATSIITEVYLGLRGQPHFTIAVKRGSGTGARILRSTLSPDWLSTYLTTLEGAGDVHAAVVNDSGIPQAATPQYARHVGDSRIVPPSEPVRGFVSGERQPFKIDYAYAWLSETPWALVVMSARSTTVPGWGWLPGNLVLFTIAFFALTGAVFWLRARQLVGRQIAAERHEADLSGQLVRAAKLASVGELAAGIAHEINNPLAIISEEVGVLEDSLDPDLPEDEEPLDLPGHLASIHEAVFRCRDITRKLLTFVRQTEVRLEMHDIHQILDDVVDGMLANEIALANVEVVREYETGIPRILTDHNQLVQILVNFVKNAIDAMARGGTLTLTTACRDNRVSIAVRDTGVGMAPDVLERAFIPFFTTKEPGKGTGLGLSVSYSIIKTFGGECYVESTPGRGSTFTVVLPCDTE
jgi:two-component system NtrC family sensor kinase